MVSYSQMLCLMVSNVMCLNPYCSGRWSRTRKKWYKSNPFCSLNPYCSGQWSRTWWNYPLDRWSRNRLNPYCSGQWSRTNEIGKKGYLAERLNPYCSGRWSRTGKVVFGGGNHVVLILIVVDNGLVLTQTVDNSLTLLVLILIVVDNGLVLKQHELTQRYG